MSEIQHHFFMLNQSTKMVQLYIIGILHLMMLSPTIAQGQGELNCVSPYGVAGSCIGIRQCPTLLRILQRQPLTPDGRDFLQQSQCGYDAHNPPVCCPLETENGDPSARVRLHSASSPTNNTNEHAADENLRYDFSNNTLLLSDCGKDMTPRIFGGERVDLDEFPWMALLEYDTVNGTVTDCGGTVISRRYVLTAAHCIKINNRNSKRIRTLKRVRLGEYNTATDRDCIQDSESSEVCADASISVEIEEKIVHEKYRPTTANKRNDIALLRLSRDIAFTNYIKPICLPSIASLGQKLYVAGWGVTESGSSSNIKLKLSLPIFDKAQCQMAYDVSGVILGHGQICAGGQNNKDSCKGDSGGPLMAVDRSRDGIGRWTIVGVVSFGPLPCGQPNWPGVYTRVIDFVPWILNKMRP